MTVDFKGAHFPKSVILHAVFFYMRCPVSYRDLQEIMAERGISVDHATLNRWVVRYAPQIGAQAHIRKRPIRGVLTKPISRFVVNGCICIELLIAMAKPLISCCLSDGIWLRRTGFSRRPS